ncbi:MAG: choline/carnitine O-acyltransferase, partial [Sciscionella sp.]
LEELATGLHSILAAAAAQDGPGDSVGHLTTKARAQWAASRRALIEHHPDNGAALEEIETALFCLCLERDTPVDALAASDALLHGDTANRWFDKALSFIVFADGTAGLNGEHCRLDGTTIVSLIDALAAEPAEEHSRRSGARAQGTPRVVPLEFALDADLRADIAEAGAAFADYAADTTTTAVALEGFGAEAIKALRVSPDAFVQLAYQLAHHRAKGCLGATYESIATRQYRHGRTEAMRVVTPEIVTFVAAMEDPSATAKRRRAAMRAAAEKHVARAKECQAGQAPEQHLWELQLIQRRRGAELGVDAAPALYDSPGWRIMREDYLSTSSVPSANVQYFGFGSTSGRCIGIGYALLATEFHLYLSTPRSVGAALRRFADLLPGVIRELRDLLAAEDREP